MVHTLSIEHTILLSDHHAKAKAHAYWIEVEHTISLSSSNFRPCCWQVVTNAVYRLWVPGGWIYAFEANPPGNENPPVQGAVFVSDHDHSSH